LIAIFTELDDDGRVSLTPAIVFFDGGRVIAGDTAADWHHRPGFASQRRNIFMTYALATGSTACQMPICAPSAA